MWLSGGAVVCVALVSFPDLQAKPLNLAWVSLVFRGRPSLRMWPMALWLCGPCRVALVTLTPPTHTYFYQAFGAVPLVQTLLFCYPACP